MMSILYIGNTDSSITDSIVDHRIHGHRHAVLGQHLDIVKLWSGSKPGHICMFTWEQA